MIEQGYWAKPLCPQVSAKIKTDDVAMRGGDYVISQLQSAAMADGTTAACVDEIMELARFRKKWLVFTSGVQHAEEVCEYIKQSGIACEYLTGEMGGAEREQKIEMFRTGEIRCLVNVAILTTGFNVPDIDMIALMRPTRSPVLYIQMIGRGVRPIYAEGDLSTKEGRLKSIADSYKPDCMVLDFGNVIQELGPIDDVCIDKVYKPKEDTDGEGVSITKTCPSCGAICAPAQKTCYDCGYMFLNIQKEAEKAKAILSTDSEPQWLDVMQVWYEKHTKANSPSSMKVSYSTSEGFVREWVCFEHHQYEVGNNKRYAWDKAVQWFNKRTYHAQLNEFPPQSVEDAINIVWPMPSKIKVKKNGKYWNVLDYEFNQPEQKEEQEFFDIPF